MYEIPQQLEYKEKIVFGLTFKQLAYAFVFFPFVFTFLFKLNASIYTRVLLASIPTILASGFMFFDLSSKIKDWYIWLRTRKLSGEKLKSFLNFGEIKDNYIYYDKKKIANLKKNRKLQC